MLLHEHRARPRLTRPLNPQWAPISVPNPYSEEAPMHDEGHLTREELLRRGAGIGIGLGALGYLPAADALAAVTESTLKRGGTFRVGVQGGSDKEVIDAQTSVLDPDAARLTALFDGLLYYDENYKLRPNLATQFTSKDAKTWTIRIRQGVEFHNGKTLTAAD